MIEDQRIIDKVRQVANEGGVAAVVLFGSRARGDYGPNSNWNCGIIMEDGVGNRGIMRQVLHEEKKDPIGIDWACALERTYMRKVAFRATPAGEIACDGKVIAGDENALEGLEIIGEVPIEMMTGAWISALTNLSILWNKLDRRTEGQWRKTDEIVHEAEREARLVGTERSQKKIQRISQWWYESIGPWYNRRCTRYGLIAACQAAHLLFLTTGERIPGNRNLTFGLDRMRAEKPVSDESEALFETLHQAVDKVQYMRNWQVPDQDMDKRPRWLHRTVESTIALGAIVQGVEYGTGPLGWLHEEGERCREALRNKAAVKRAEWVRYQHLGRRLENVPERAAEPMRQIFEVIGSLRK